MMKDTGTRWGAKLRSVAELDDRRMVRILLVRGVIGAMLAVLSGCLVWGVAVWSAWSGWSLFAVGFGMGVGSWVLAGRMTNSWVVVRRLQKSEETLDDMFRVKPLIDVGEAVLCRYVGLGPFIRCSGTPFDMIRFELIRPYDVDVPFLVNASSALQATLRFYYPALRRGDIVGLALIWPLHIYGSFIAVPSESASYAAGMS